MCPCVILMLFYHLLILVNYVIIQFYYLYYAYYSQLPHLVVFAYFLSDFCYLCFKYP